ncbi:hypothetical protein yaldo0001_5800 [Yersinia aldovae ATCC 35236]|nr:hypothetical protein yaldo0001_5800 [Yersinia aldovae ATCC 35236]
MASSTDLNDPYTSAKMRSKLITIYYLQQCQLNCITLLSAHLLSENYIFGIQLTY